MSAHITGQILGQEVHLDTLYFAWACMGAILIAAAILRSGVSADINKYGHRQHLAEGFFGFIRSLTTMQIGKKVGDKFTFFVGSIFIFILIAYYAGLFPWKLGEFFSWWPRLPVVHGEHHAHIWHGASPCADMNVTAGIAILVVIAYVGAGAAIGGWQYIQSYLPINISKKGITLNLMCLIELMDLLIRPLTLSLRLFANTVAGETLLATFIGLVALVIPIVMIGFEMFVGVLQAFLFTILASVYIGTAVQHAEHVAHGDHH
jgi:F-type H+-transporting ATPase subunit a